MYTALIRDAKREILASTMQTRRDFLLSATAGVGAALAADRWDAGLVEHLLPTVNHRRLLLKASFTQALKRAPGLRVGNRVHPGIRADFDGRFWAFDVDGLKPEHPYNLQLAGGDGKPLCAPWSLSTFPEMGATPERFRLMIYTCAGGHEALRDPAGRPLFIPLENRRKLLQTGLAYRPNAVIAVGDHVYWDLRVGRGAQMQGKSAFALQLVGEFNRAAPVLGTDNEKKLKLAVHPQIAGLYGTMFRSTPVFFLQDDHDYFDNDEAHESIVTFPPDDFMLRLARATQKLYYPEFLPDPNRPLGLPGASAEDRPAGVGECFGTLRYGKLLEILLYDCRRYLTLAGPAAGFLPQTVETWLRQRMAAEETRHLVNLPSTPVGWSAGKWGEWYPDVLLDNGALGTQKPKYFWQSGWGAQHDRLLEAASAMQRIPLFLSGDLHALAEGKILSSGKLDLRRNPIVSILTGPVSTGPPGWPSAARGTAPLAASRLEVEEGLKPLEKNGFSIVDFTPDQIEIRFFNWKLGEPEVRLEDLKPFRHSQFQRRV